MKLWHLLEFEFFLFMYNTGWIELGALGLGIEIKPFLGNQNCVQRWDPDNEEYWNDVPCNAKHNVFVCERDGKANMTLTIHTCHFIII